MSFVLSDKSSVQDFFALCEWHGLHDMVLCPGSRNAPFSISLHNDPRFTTYAIPDERSAAFFALGMAQQKQKAVVLICTSGTAVLNFAPAIAEAYYQRVPLLIVTADRPHEWIDQGEGQSIRQNQVYANYIKASFEIQEEAIHPDIIWHNNRIMDEAMRLTDQGVWGPVHINFPLREPLYKTVPYAPTKIKCVERIASSEELQPSVIETLTARVEGAKKVLILAGQHHPDQELKAAIKQWTNLPNVVVMTEAHSNLAEPNWCSTIDRTITGLKEETLRDWYPEILISFGHNIISRKVKDWLRKGETEHWHIDVSGEGLDTLKQLRNIISMVPAAFFKSVVPQAKTDSSYQSDITCQVLKREKTGEKFLQNAEWSDLLAFSMIYPNIPSGYHLQMGNSSVVRYILLMNARSDLFHFGNRGVAGIDGCTSTSVGACKASGQPTVLISGDIAFFYDSNAFWNNYVEPQLKIIVINNQGGGIFRIIDGPNTSPAIGEFFETTHQRTVKGFADMYHLDYKVCDSAQTLAEGLNWLWGTSTCSVLEIQTPRLENDRILKDYFKALQASDN
jgi:2-succinyl-5-enolpyruvyl-6-hydroxy-3-cyclohexene-1-carboxylate synthase